MSLDNPHPHIYFFFQNCNGFTKFEFSTRFVESLYCCQHHNTHGLLNIVSNKLNHTKQQYRNKYVFFSSEYIVKHRILR